MTLDEILKGLFPSGHDVKTSAAGQIAGTGKRKQGGSIAVIGVANGAARGTAGVLLLASTQGHRTIGLEYGKAAAGAFLATALATDCLVGLPGAEPTVMDLPSMARVTKLPEEKLKELAKTTPVFAPGLDHMFQMGAFAEIWDPKKPLDEQLEQTLSNASSTDTRDELGAQRKGRLMTAVVAKRVIAEATGQR